MSPEEREELAALYALDLLEGDELLNFRRAIAADPKLGVEVDEYRAASNLLGRSVPQYKAPSHLRDPIVHAFLAQKAPPKPLPAEKINFLGWLPWAIAACLIIFSGFLFVEKSNLSADLSRQKKEKSGLEVRVASLEGERARLEGRLNALQAEKDSLQTRFTAIQNHDPLSDIATVTLAPQPNTLATGLALALWNSKTQSGILNAAQLPPPGPDKDYQLWIVPPGASPVSAGILGNTPAANMPFRSPEPIAQVAALAISLEPKGGSSSPSGPIVYLGKL